MADISDEQLIEDYRRKIGTPEADTLINQLFERYRSRVALWCLRITGNSESAADLAQDVFMKAFCHLDSYRGDSRFSTWLYSIARNHCFSEAKSSGRRESQPSELIVDELVDPAASPLEMLEQEDSAAVLRELMQTTLTETENRVLTMHYGEELPLDVVTRLLGLRNDSGAKAQIVSARRKLARAVDRWRARQPRTGRR